MQKRQFSILEETPLHNSWMSGASLPPVSFLYPLSFGPVSAALWVFWGELRGIGPS